MKATLFLVLSVFLSVSCSKQEPEAEKAKIEEKPLPAAVDPRASQELLDKARGAAGAANAQSEEMLKQVNQ